MSGTKRSPPFAVNIYVTHTYTCMYVNPPPDAACVSRHPANKITKTVIPGEGSAKLEAKLLGKRKKKKKTMKLHWLDSCFFFGFRFFKKEGKNHPVSALPVCWSKSPLQISTWAPLFLPSPLEHYDNGMWRRKRKDMQLLFPPLL